jgi:hypothetical protein
MTYKKKNKKFILSSAVDARSGFKSFLNDNQIQSETRTFTIITQVENKTFHSIKLFIE